MSIFGDVSANSHRNIQILFEKYLKQQQKTRRDSKRVESPYTPAGAHLRKLGIRLHSATALERQKLPTATECRTNGSLVMPSNEFQTAQRQRQGLRSAPGGLYAEVEYGIPSQLTSKKVKHSLAVYSPQSQRFDTETDRTSAQTLLAKRVNYKPHRIDRRFYVSGANCHILNRYEFDEEQGQSLVNFLNRRKTEHSKSKKLGIEFFKNDQTESGN